MAIRSQWRAWLCLAAILGVIVFCAWHSKARAEPSPTPVPFEVALAPLDKALDLPPAPSTGAPFGLAQTAPAAAPAQAMTAKWKSLQSIIAIETRLMASCRAMPEVCAPSTARFLAIVDAARVENGRARAGLINRAINLAIRPARDNALFGVADVWQSPLMTFASGSGDCEDYAIAKYVALREAGLSTDDVRLVIVRDDALGEEHAVTAARIDGEWLILDNRKMVLLTDAQAADLKPLIALGDDAPKPVFIRDAGLDGWLVATMATPG